MTEGFIDYDRQKEDPNGEVPSGTMLDTYDHANDKIPTTEMLEVEKRFLKCEIPYHTAEEMLDALAAKRDI